MRMNEDSRIIIAAPPAGDPCVVFSFRPAALLS